MSWRYLLKAENLVAKLKDYLERHSLTLTAFAQRIDAPVSSVHRYVTGESIPAREIMIRIVEATAGEVTANDFYGIEDGPKAPISDGVDEVLGLVGDHLAETQEGREPQHPQPGSHLRVVTSEGEP
jgi:hypothetical protein